MSTGNLAVTLPRYDGPLDLLFSLVRRNEYPAADVPVGEITRQFMEYLERAEAPDIEIGSEFIEMAALLIVFKSQSLLPRPAKEITSEQAKDSTPLSPEALKALLNFLRKQMGRTGFHPEREISGFIEATGTLIEGPPTIQDVVAAARNALQAARAHNELPLPADPYTVENRLSWIQEKLSEVDTTQIISTAGWFQEQPTPAARSALFLALLELPRLGQFRLLQRREFGEIFLRAA